MEGTWAKLPLLVLLLAFASLHAPLRTEARCKRNHHSNHDPNHHGRKQAPSPATAVGSEPPTPAPAQAPASKAFSPVGALVPEPAPSPNQQPEPALPTPEFSPTWPPPDESPPPEWNYGIGVPSPEGPPPPYQVHGCGHRCVDSNDCDWPCTTCCANRTCCYDTFIDYDYPVTSPPAESPEPKHPRSPAPALATAPASEALGALVPEPAPNQQPASAPLAPEFPRTPPSESLPPNWNNGIGVPVVVPEGPWPPYQVHGCGHRCVDSNDCDWPCTSCCANRTCCYDPYIDYDYPVTSPPAESPESKHPTSPAPALAPAPASEALGALVPEPAPIQQPASAPPAPEFPRTPPSESLPPNWNNGIGVPVVVPEGPTPPYQPHGCGYSRCFDDNDCDWPCIYCCANHKCCNETTYFAPQLPPSAP